MGYCYTEYVPITAEYFFFLIFIIVGNIFIASRAVISLYERINSYFRRVNLEVLRKVKYRLADDSQA